MKTLTNHMGIVLQQGKKNTKCDRYCDEPRSIPSGKHTKNYGKSPCFMGKLTISMAIFNSNLLVYQAGSAKEIMCWDVAASQKNMWRGP